jgi:hypothetical protein
LQVEADSPLSKQQTHTLQAELEQLRNRFVELNYLTANTLQVSTVPQLLHL